MKISATEFIDNIIIEDCTGEYSSDNKGGYGIPNPRLEDISDAYIEVRPPSFTGEGYPFKITTSPDYPAKKVAGYEILPYQVGMTGNEIESGEWKFKQTVVFTKGNVTTTKSVTTSEIFFKGVECCIDKLSANRLSPGAFNDEKQKLIIELSNLIEDVKKQIDCGQTESAKKTIDYLKSHCKCCGC